MAINSFFANYSHQGTQQFLESLTKEMIQIYGIECYYITRGTRGGLDPLLREDALPVFDKAFPIEMYVKNAESYEGEGSFLSKFGVQIRDQMTMVVAKSTFQDITNHGVDLNRPTEGDLIYIPLLKGMFEIMYAPHSTVFYQAGNLHIWEMKCDRFELSNEKFETGIPMIDELYQDHDYTDVTDIADLTDFDPFANNKVIQDESEDVLDFANLNPLTPNGKW